jgi:hypothetical protein
MKLFLNNLTIAAILVTALSGCASILTGSTQTITVNSNVSGAQVFMNDTLLGKTPLTVTVDRGLEGALTVKADGYQSYNFALNKKITTTFWVNILSGGLFGSSTDMSTGAMYEYEPGTFQATLAPMNASSLELDTFEKEAALRRFLLVNHEAVVRQLASGEGTHLETLYGALEIAQNQREPQRVSWNNIYRSSTTTREFADAFINSVKL